MPFCQMFRKYGTRGTPGVVPPGWYPRGRRAPGGSNQPPPRGILGGVSLVDALKHFPPKSTKIKRLLASPYYANLNILLIMITVFNAHLVPSTQL